MRRFLSWFLGAIPRAPKRAGLLMRLYYVWREYFTYPGRACAALFLFSIFAGAFAGFWAAWIFSGFVFLFFLSLVPSLFLTSKKTKLSGSVSHVENAIEGENAYVSVRLQAGTAIDCVWASCSRMDPSLDGESSPELRGVPAGGTGELRACIRTRFRGAYRIPKVSLTVPEIKGMLCNPFKVGEAEILVYPRPKNVTAFPFLTAGQSGLAFVPLLMSNFMRGLDFAGVREYREGDSLRDLYYRAFARYGRPFTKEFEGERGAGVVLVLDTRARNLREKSVLEPMIRLAAGIGMWLLDRGILGRLFVCDDEFSLAGTDAAGVLLETLARIPRAEIYAREGVREKRARDPKKAFGGPKKVSRDRKQASRGRDDEPELWSPAARPMGPVLRVGLFAVKDPLVHKQVVVCASAREHNDDTLFVPIENLDAGEVSL